MEASITCKRANIVVWRTPWTKWKQVGRSSLPSLPWSHSAEYALCGGSDDFMWQRRFSVCVCGRCGGMLRIRQKDNPAISRTYSDTSWEYYTHTHILFTRTSSSRLSAILLLNLSAHQLGTGAVRMNERQLCCQRFARETRTRQRENDATPLSPHSLHNTTRAGARAVYSFEHVRTRKSVSIMKLAS